MPLALLWFSLVRQLSVEWSINPQYTYGWAVPFLCLYLVWRKVESRRQKAEVGGKVAEGGNQTSECPLPSSSFHLLFALCALLLLPARLIQVANPQWRTAAWFVTLVVIGLTLCALRFALASSPARSVSTSRFLLSAFPISAFLFPLCFFLVAVPWPTTIEAPFIQSLTRANAATTIELLGLFGIPAMQHGNIIEISTGVVGIDDACSGIRSFQATLMISLLLGELYRLTVLRRTALCLAGFALSFFFNVGRTSLLAWVAARDGVEAISRWHDPAGVSILLGCFLGLWLAALGLRRKAESRPAATPRKQGEYQVSETAHPLADRRHPASGFRLASVAFAVWVFAVFGGVEWWFRAHERNLKKQPVWTAAVPSDMQNVTRIPFSDSVKSILRFSAGEHVAWQDAAGLRWQMTYLRWSASRIAAHAAQGHNPQGCLTSTGRKLLSSSPIKFFEIHGLSLPFQHYEFEDGRQKLHVLYCLWQDHAETQVFSQQELRSLRSRLQGIWTGRRNLGQRSIELALWGVDDAVEAEAAMRAQLDKLITIEK